MHRLHELLEQATEPGAMTGLAWSELTELVEGSPHLVLHPPRLWGAIAEQLLGELVVAENTAWLQRQEAMSRLLEHSSAGRYATEVCIALADDVDSPVVVEPLSLLEITDHPAANSYVLRQLQHPASDRAHYGALLATVRKAAHGHFCEDDWPHLVACLRQTMTDPDVPQPLRPLVLQVAAALARTVPGAAAVLGNQRPAGVGLTRHHSTESAVIQTVSNRIAAAAQRELSDETGAMDVTLVRLVKESLYHSNPDHRLVAALLISATPYREPVARALQAEVTAHLTRRSDADHTVALQAMTLLGVDLHRQLVQDILLGTGFSVALRHAAAWAVPHCAGQYTEPQWRRILARQVDAWTREPSDLTEGILQGVTYGIGTDGHQRLLAEIQVSLRMPASARRTASWLLRTPRPDR
ncbi:hypothetical protein ABZ754_27465 [Micromonospora purpureochromogenes]|uniref:hypothetical protein n=1 Tax=Micromonospora purpureochromogenes TaxID=47872 RepID=UPI0033DF795C